MLVKRTTASEIGAGAGRIRRANFAAIMKAAEQVFAEKGFVGATMAEIAEAASLPKANLHYYFGTKEELYQAVLGEVLELWLNPTSVIHPDADPADAIGAYVRSKMAASRARPFASKVFANEILHGATQIEKFLSQDLRALVEDKAAVLEGWVAEGRIARMDTRNFFFMVWAITQHYADFDTQVQCVLGKKRLTQKDHDHFTEEVTRFILRAAGLAPERADAT